MEVTSQRESSSHTIYKCVGYKPADAMLVKSENFRICEFSNFNSGARITVYVLFYSDQLFTVEIFAVKQMSEQ